MTATIEEIKKLPKIELHAHLSGSVRYSTIIRLLNNELLEKNFESFLSEEQLKKEIELLEILKSKPLISSTNTKSLSECFQVFTILHRLLNNQNILKQVTEEILLDFLNDNCIYVELRTTPRNIFDPITKELKVSKKDYLQTITNVVKDFECKYSNKMLVRLILSIDRAKGLQDGLENIELANEFKDNYVVGIDFSGNPNVSTFKNFKILFDLAKKYSLKTTVHTAEIWQDEDVNFILKEIRPDRIGHSVCLNKDQINYLINNPIPIEICPTSNLITKCVESIDKHPFYEFYTLNRNYPLVICTDDFGIFDTSLSREYFLISNAFNLNIQSMFDLAKRSINYIFDKNEKTIKFLNEKFIY